MPGDEQGVPIPHGVLGGLVTDITPPLTVEGLSPDCQDIVFLPQQVKQREGLKRLFPAGFFDNPVYQKTYIPPNEEEVNLFIDALGKLYVEDPATFPGTYNLVADLPLTGIVTAQSVTAFGREYIACSDGEHGVNVPLQYDGTFLDRVSQDGPGNGVGAGETFVPVAIAAAPIGLVTEGPYGIKAIGGLTESGHTVTVTGTSLFEFFGTKLRAGDQIVIAGATNPAYDGTWTLTNAGATALQFTHPSTGLAASGGGTVTTNIVTVATAGGVQTGFVTGQSVTIVGATDAAYDGVWTIRGFPGSSNDTSVFYITIATFGEADSGGGDIAIAGTIAAGVHSVVCLFLTRQGYITKPSQATSWTASGSGAVSISNIPTGPSNVIARILAFTGAGGQNYFYIPVDFTLPGSTSSVSSTVIQDNITTFATFNFDDNALFAATSIDVAGRNYFAQVVLGEVLGFFPYASRLAAWGERNKVQNLINMGFEGGIQSGDLTQPLGWSLGGANGVLVNGGAWPSGMAWQITDDGTNVGNGDLTQTASVDALGIPILQPLTRYTTRLWAKISSASPGSGSVTCRIQSPSTGFTTTVNIPYTSVSTNGGFIEGVLDHDLPASIPGDMQISWWVQGPVAGIVVTLDELNVIPTENPYRDSLFRFSYVNAPEQFDGVTGVLGSTSDFTPIRNCFQIRNTMYYNTQIGKSSTTDNGTGEPSTWLVPEVSETVGSLSVHGSDNGRIGTGESAEQWQFTISEQGVYVFAGGDDMRISQEIARPTENGFPGWDSINMQAIGSSWVKNDTTNRRLYIGVPTGTATAPNVVFVLDYRNLNSAWDIAQKGPYQAVGGRLLANEIGRKWTRWTLTFNTAEELSRGGDAYQICFGAGNGETPGVEPGVFCNVYRLDETKLTDDDYGQIVPYRFTHFFPTPDARQQYRLGAHRVIATYLAMLIGGTGFTAITPVVNTLRNTFPDLAPYPLNSDQTYDYEWDVWVDGERIALKIGSVPALGQTDNGFLLQDLSLTLKKDPWSPIRGTMLA